MSEACPPGRGRDREARQGGPSTAAPKLRRRGAWSAVAGLAVVLSALAAVAGKDTLVRALLEAKLHRPVSFASLSMHPGGGGTRLVFTDLRIGQPARFGPGELARVPRLELTVRLAPLLAGRFEAPEVTATGLDLHLRRHGRNDDNWTFGHGGGASSFLGATRRLEVRDGHVSMDDTALGLTLRAAVSHAPPGPAMPLRLEGGGVLKGQPYRVSAAGGPLNGRPPGSPHPIDVTLVDGATHVRMRGATQAPFDFRGLDADVAADGPNLADMVYLFSLSTPNSPPFTATAHMRRQGEVFETSRIVVRIGDSDVEGRVRSEHRAHRTIDAVLRSRRLRAQDLRILLAKPPPHEIARSTPGAAAKEASRQGRVFPQTPVSLDRKNEVEATLDYAVAAASGFGPEVSDARLKLRLAGGRLALAPLTFATAGGAVRVDYRLNAVGRPSVDLGLRARGLHVSRLHGRGGFSGLLDADLDLHGSGASPAQQAADATGRASLRVRGGALPKLDAAALSGDVFGLLGAALSPRARTPLKCVAADFTVRAGVAEATRLAVSTDEGSARGGGRIDLGRERIDLTLKATQGGRGLLQVRTPITLSGPLSKPRVSARLADARPGLGGLSRLGAALKRVVTGSPPRAAAPAPAAC